MLNSIEKFKVTIFTKNCFETQLLQTLKKLLAGKLELIYIFILGQVTSN